MKRSKPKSSMKSLLGEQMQKRTTVRQGREFTYEPSGEKGRFPPEVYHEIYKAGEPRPLPRRDYRK